MRTTAPEPIPAAWYQAPGEAFVDRYWDGTAWTERSRPRPPQPARVVTTSPPGDRVPRATASTWVVAVLGAALLVAGTLLQGRGAVPSGLLGSGGGLVLGVAGTLLRHDAGSRACAILCVPLGAALLVAGTVAAVTGTAVAWVDAATGLGLLVAGVVRLVRPRSSAPVAPDDRP